jgi:NAD(P)H-hydrate epimerase
MVVDADAINAIAECPSILQTANGPRILTPHPGEMERLAPGYSACSRRDTVETFTRGSRCTLLLKGARTIVGESGLPFSVNTTGTPGMAKGGNGDVLTGVIAALVGQRVLPYDAARLGAWLCGRASEIAISHGGETEETLSPSRALDFLGAAFRELRGRCY